MDYLYEEIQDSTVYKVVRNNKHQYSIWYAERKNPHGWNDAGFQGSKEDCLSFIEALWSEKNSSRF